MLQQEKTYTVSVYATKYVNNGWQEIGWIEKQVAVTRASDSPSSKYDRYLKPMPCERSCEVECSANRGDPSA